MASAEAGLVLGSISAIISIIDATKKVYEAVEDDAGLPTNFKKSAMKLLLILKLLEHAEEYVNNETDESIKTAFTPTLEDCKAQAIQLQELFEKVMPEEGDSRWDRYIKAARTIGEGGRVESLVGGILGDLQLLATRFPEVTTSRGKDQLATAIEEVTNMELSLPAGFEKTPAYAHYGSGAQNVYVGGGNQYINGPGNQLNGPGNQLNGPGNQYNGTNYIVNNHKITTPDDIDRSCLRILRCPDTLAVKNRLKEDKDKLLPKSIDWILQDPKYISWKDGEDVCLLWIKGGAGKGKTMISIGLIERLSRPQDKSTVVTYFFCQEADYELKTLEAIVKGLILQLVTQQKDVKESLRRRWDTTNERFDEDVTSWRTLWNIFLEMLSRCKCARVYVIVDALDECQDNGMADFLKLIVRTGLDQPSKIKWLLTSRPLDSAERELLTGSDQVGVSLELNQKQLSEVVRTFITSKVIELDRRHHYGPTLRQKVETELAAKAEDTMLWVSLVCRRLENVHRDKALTTIQHLPPDLPDFYRRVFNQLNEGESAVVKGCMRLLKAMMLAYRPLNVEEVGSVTGLSEQLVVIEVWVDRCASFVKRRGAYIEFVHQSARDYLAGRDGQSIFDAYENYGHDWVEAIAFSLDGERIASGSRDNTIKLWNASTGSLQNTLTGHLDWVGAVAFSLDGERIASGSRDNTIKLWDASTGSLQNTLTGHLDGVEAIAFSLDGERIASGSRDNTIKLWDATGSLQNTLTGHLDWVITVAFSLDSKQIASGSRDNAIKLWDTSTGSLQKTLTSHSSWVKAIAFSLDGKHIASGSRDNTIKLWDTSIGSRQKIGSLEKTRIGHLGWITTIALSLDGKQIATGSEDDTIKLWDATGSLQKTLVGHSGLIGAIAFSPDRKQIATGSGDNTIKLWDATGSLQKTLVGHSGLIGAIAFSPDGKQIATGSGDNTIKLWDATGSLQKTLVGHSGFVGAIAFSPDGKHIATGSGDNTIKLWDATGSLQKTLIGHSGWVEAVAFSPDGKQIATGSDDKTIKLWDVTKSLKVSKLLGSTLGSHLRHRAWREIKTSKPVNSLKFSANGRHLITNLGQIKIESILENRQSFGFESLESLGVNNQWIYYGAMPIFRLPLDFEVQCHDVAGDQLGIGFRNGRVLGFYINRKSLNSIFKNSA
ncbi:hypothetical protein ACLOAV_006486 [Pseudogymnoascus australis]